MKKSILLLTVALCQSWIAAKAQSNYLDNYIGASVTLTTIGNSTNQLNHPTDLDFKPNSNELWVCNYEVGGSIVILYNAGLANQTSQYRQDTHSGHFMVYPSAISFGEDGKWACVSEIQSTSTTVTTFMGPALWLSDTSIFARVFQNNWVSGLPLGSHIDMLHQSPFAMGIAHDSAMAYWVMDGYNGNICKYDFVQDHGPGYDDHSAGKIWRYIDVTVTRVPQVSSHMVLDKATGWLYFVDGGPKKIKRLNTNTGIITGTLTTPPTAPENLAGYWKVETAVVEELDTFTTQPSGIDFYNNRLIVSDYTTGDIYLYNTSGTFTLLTTIVTGHPGMMGVKVGPDGHIWCVNKTEYKVYRLDVALPSTDVSIVSITSPSTENWMPSFYSTSFDVCDGNITPVITISNNGTTTVNSVDLQYTVGNGSPVTYTWTGTLTTGNTASVTFPSASVANGSHILAVSINSVNGTADDVDLNNTFTGSFRAVNPPVSLPYTQGFSSIIFPPAGWNYVHFNPNNNMARVTTGGFGSSVGSMKMDNFSGNMDITGQKDYLMSPVLDFNTASANTYLRFNVAYAKYNASSNDALQVVVSTDCGNTWTQVYYKSGTALSTAPATTGSFTPTPTQWRTDSVSMAAYAGLSEVIIMFTSISNWGNNLYVDDIFAGDISTGTPELVFENNFNVFPNPVTSTLQLTVPGNLTHDMRGTIFSADGKALNTFLIPADKQFMNLNFSGYANGIYAVRIYDNKNVLIKTVIKQ